MAILWKNKWRVPYINHLQAIRWSQTGYDAKAKQKMTDRMQSPDASTEKAWRSDTETHGPYDNPESLSLGDRCLLGASLATPLIPNELYNNYVRIVQSGNKVMILTEMIHDARIIRLNSEHLPDDIRKMDWRFDRLVGRRYTRRRHNQFY